MPSRPNSVSAWSMRRRTAVYEQSPDSYRQRLVILHRIALLFPRRFFRWGKGDNMSSHPLPTLALILIFLFALPAVIFYLLTLQNALKRCAPASRTMPPGMVWLLLIPAFGLLWHFVVVMYIAKSLRNEFARLEIPCSESAPGQNIGLAACACNCAIFLPLLGGLASIAGLVLWIDYWIKIAHYSRDLEEHQAISPVSPIA
jgi:hypothetical protein